MHMVWSRKAITVNISNDYYYYFVSVKYFLYLFLFYDQKHTLYSIQCGTFFFLFFLLWKEVW